MESKKEDRALRWPYGIALSFIGIIALIYGTIVVSMEYPVEKSDQNLQNYHVYDKNANVFIQKKIEFDKAYKFAYVGAPLTMTQSVLAYELTDKAGKPVSNAEIEGVITRPNEHAYDIALKNPHVEGSIYTFDPIDLPKAGRWNIIVAVKVGEHLRYLSLKADTRNPNMFEY